MRHVSPSFALQKAIELELWINQAQITWVNKIKNGRFLITVNIFPPFFCIKKTLLMINPYCSPRSFRNIFFCLNI